METGQAPRSRRNMTVAAPVVARLSSFFAGGSFVVNESLALYGKQSINRDGPPFRFIC